jgi:hypothetical protein
MNELTQLRKERAECTARMTARASNIEAADKAAGLGDQGAEVRLVGPQKQRERDAAAPHAGPVSAQPRRRQANSRGNKQPPGAVLNRDGARAHAGKQ